MIRTLALYPWSQALSQLVFWQAVWFLYFQGQLSAESAIVLAALYDVTVVALEVPLGYLSDRIGRRATLMLAGLAGAAGCVLLFVGDVFWVLLAGQMLLATAKALQSGTDSALLYDTLAALGRTREVAAQETKAFRFRFGALAVSALTGGLLAEVWMAGVYLATAAAFAGAFVLTALMRDPPEAPDAPPAQAPVAQVKTVLGRLSDPVLRWIFVSAVGGYAIGHVPFVFGQPYLEEALRLVGAGGDAPVAMGALTALMMVLSLAASHGAPAVRRRFGLAGSFLIGRAMQAGLVGAMAFVIHPVAAALMMVRMVPDALIRPYEMEAIQPRLKSGYRATYLSVQNQCGSLAFSASLLLCAWTMGDLDRMDPAALDLVLGAYFVAALALVGGLAVTSGVLREAEIDQQRIGPDPGEQP